MTLLAHLPAYRAVVASAFGLLVAPAAFGQPASPATATPATKSAPSATLPPEPTAPAPSAQASVAQASVAQAPAAPAPTPAPAAPASASDSSDAYLDADFPNVAQVPVAPPVATARHGERASAAAERTQTSFDSTDTGYERLRERKPRGPKATERGPFLIATADILIAADYYNILAGGIGGGAFLKDRFRLSGTLSAPLEFTARTHGDVDSPEIVFGANAGIALVRRQVFALSLVADVTTTNSSDLGWNVGLALPLEWVTRSGFRFGVMPGLFQNFGTSGALDCDDYAYDYDTGRSSCGSGTAPPETGVRLHAQVGFTLK